MNRLFVCTLGEQRSPTAARVWNEMHPDDRVDFMGVFDARDESEKKKLLEWADTIHVMEELHREVILEITGSLATDEKITMLGIPDMYDRDSPALVRLLQEKFRQK